MEITIAMMRAREAEFAHQQQAGGGNFEPLFDAVLRAIIDAAISAIGEDDEPEVVEPEPVQSLALPSNVRIVRASKPKPKPRSDR